MRAGRRGSQLIIREIPVRAFSFSVLLEEGAFFSSSLAAVAARAGGQPASACGAEGVCVGSRWAYSASPPWERRWAGLSRPQQGYAPR